MFTGLGGRVAVQPSGLVVTMMTMNIKKQNKISHRGWVGERDGRERRGHFRRDGDELILSPRDAETKAFCTLVITNAGELVEFREWLWQNKWYIEGVFDYRERERTLS